MTYFRTCSSRRTRSQAPLCHYTRRLVSNQAEGTFARLRYSLGGDRPSQTTYHALSRWLHATRLDIHRLKGGISHCDSMKAGASTSTSTTYSTHETTNASAKL